MTDIVNDMTNNDAETPNVRRIRLSASCSGEVSQAIENKYSIAQSWADWLNSKGPWSWFGTFTFRGSPHEEQANKAWMLYTHKINRAIYGPNYYKHPEKGITWARASELQQRGAIHYHAVLGRIGPNMDSKQWQEEWFNMEGIARIEQYLKDKGAEFYMSKNAYAWKHGQIDLGGPLNQSSIVLTSKT